MRSPSAGKISHPPCRRGLAPGSGPSSAHATASPARCPGRRQETQAYGRLSFLAGPYKGAPKGKAKADPKGRPSPKKKTVADKWDPSWATHIDGHELCKKFGLGKCKNKNCRFAPSGHRCPVPDAAGNPCGQEHSAVEHLAAGH